MVNENAEQCDACLFDGGGECLRLRGVLVRADRKGQSPMVGSHYLLKEPFCRGDITLCRKHELSRITISEKFLCGSLNFLVAEDTPREFISEFVLRIVLLHQF